MKDKQKLYQKIRLYEREVLIASPSRAAKLATKLNKWKSKVFD
jgi:hypothetical protein